MPRVSGKRRRAARTIVVQVRMSIELRNEVARHANADTISISAAARQMIAEAAKQRRDVEIAKADHVKAAA